MIEDLITINEINGYVYLKDTNHILLVVKGLGFKYGFSPFNLYDKVNKIIGCNNFVFLTWRDQHWYMHTIEEDIRRFEGSKQLSFSYEQGEAITKLRREQMHNVVSQHTIIWGLKFKCEEDLILIKTMLSI